VKIQKKKNNQKGKIDSEKKRSLKMTSPTKALTKNNKKE